MKQSRSLWFLSSFPPVGWDRFDTARCFVCTVRCRRPFGIDIDIAAVRSSLGKERLVAARADIAVAERNHPGVPRSVGVVRAWALDWSCSVDSVWVGSESIDLVLVP